MKRIRSAAMLAAILAFSGTSQAQSNHTPRRGQLEDALGAHVQPTAYRATTRDELRARGMDYTHESRLNDRHRHELRDKARATKAQVRSL